MCPWGILFAGAAPAARRHRPPYGPRIGEWEPLAVPAASQIDEERRKDMIRVTMRAVISAVAAVVTLAAACASSPSVSSRAPDPHLVFPTRSDQGGMMMQALFTGPLVSRQGCVLIGRPDDYSFPVWPKGFTAERDDSGRVVVQDAEGT